MDIASLYQLFLQHPQVSTDSRNCLPGCLFFALKGESFDGNRFTQQALETAAYAIIDDPAAQTDNRTILVADVLQTLQELACMHRQKMGILIVGITGTNGKTTTKELTAAVLAMQHETLSTAGNLNNHIGVPLTLLRLRPEHRIAVIEMGANHPGEIETLVNIVRPDCGLITNIGTAHLEGFGSVEGVLKTKGELYDYLRRTGGTVFRYSGDERLQSIADGLSTVTYGTFPSDDIRGEPLGCAPCLHFRWSTRQQQSQCTVDTRLVGDYNLPNLLAAIAVGKHFGISDTDINRALENYTPSNNRSQLQQTDRNTLIVDAYNANPSSMKAALINFAAIKADAKTVILGDMLELGIDSRVLHTEVADLLSDFDPETVLLCGREFCALELPYRSFETVDDLNRYLDKANISDRYILIKGSRGIRLETTVDHL